VQFGDRAVRPTLEIDSMVPALAAVFGASYGFMLPVSTPPNAIVYRSGMVPITKMIRSIGLDGTGREGKPEGRAMARRALDPDAAAVPLDDLLADGQTDAGARALLLQVQALEDSKDAVSELPRDADTVVVDGDQPRGIPRFGRDLDARCAGARSRLPDGW
jgi:hypothetical protein